MAISAGDSGAVEWANGVDSQFAALPATYAPLAGAQNIIIGLGDSLTIGNDTTTGTLQHGDSTLTWATMLSGGRIVYGGNAGIAGQTSTQIAARVQADVIAHNPGGCIILAGTNDLSAPDFGVYQTNIRSIVTALRAAGIRPFLSTMPPSGITGYRATITAWNAWLRRYATIEQIDLIDGYSLLVDPATGDYSASYINDGVHPNVAGWKAWGQLVSDTLSPRLPNVHPVIPWDNNDPNNLLSNGLNINGSPLATGFYDYSGLIAGASRSIVTDALVPGNMQRLELGTTAGDNIVAQDIGTGFSPGDLLAFSTVFTASAGVAYVEIMVNFTSGVGPNTKPIHITQPVTRGQVYMEMTVPAGTTSIATLWRVNGVSCTADFGQRGLYNLTALGIATP